MKSLYLHIGAPNTGTPYLQEFLKKNSEVLKKYDVYYPIPRDKSDAFLKGEDTFSKQEAATDLNRPAMEDLLKDINEAEQRNVLLSCDAFYDTFVDQVALSKLKETFKEFEVKVIVYLRRQDHALLSFFQEGCKNGTRTEFNFDKLLEDVHSNLLYYDRLSQWGDVFGVSNIIVRTFETSSWIEKDLCADFLNTLGIPHTPEFETNPLVDEALSQEKLLFLMELNKQLGGLEKEVDQKIRSFVISDPHILKKGLLSEWLTPEEQHLMLTKYEPQNARIVERFFTGQKENLFADQPGSEDTTKKRTLEENARFETYARLLEHIEIERNLL